MGFFSWILFGLLAGAAAKLIMPGRDPGGWIVTCLLGVFGASVGGYIATHFGYGKVTGFDLRSFAVAVGGSLVLLTVYRFVFGKKRS